ncbi:MAG TPA: ABC transporter permease [Terriglobia bacterium]|nr:ABC transporter permease [Terriglobia bacterium]
MRHFILKLVRRRRLERDLEAELRFHEEMASARDNPIRLGNRTRIKDEIRDAWRLQLIDTVWRDATHGIRQLWRNPAFAVAAVLTLALAIGATSAMFAVVERVVLNPLPYPKSDRLIQLDHSFPVLNLRSGIGMTAGLYYQYLDRGRALDGVAIFRTDEMTVTGGGEPERVRVTSATTTLFPVLQVQPAIGRWFTEQEGAAGAPQVALLSHALWMRRYGGDVGMLGRSVALNGVPTEIIGVMPASFAFPDSRIDAWINQQVTRATGFGLPFRFLGIARLRDGATVADARKELNSLIADLSQAYPGDPGVSGNIGNGKLTSSPMTLKEATVGDVERPLWILLASVVVVLLIACANVANLFMVRAEARQREIAVRRALGAGGTGIARLFVAESALLSIAAAFAGVALAWGALRLLVAYGPATLPRIEEIRLDSMTIAFTFVLTLLTTIAFGAIPLTRRAPLSAFLEGGRSTTAGRRRHRARQLLMGAQVALALVLLVSSGLMVRSFQKLRTLDPGFNAASALTFRIGLPNREYPSRAAAVAAHQAIIDRLSALPGVTAVSASSALPLQDGCFGNTVLVEGRVNPTGTIPPGARLCAVAGGYVETMGMRLLRGSSIDRGGVARGELIAIVNQAFADAFFPSRDPIGERVRSNAPPRSTPRPDGAGGLTWDGAPPWLTIVGVVSNTPAQALAEPHPTPMLFMPMSIAGGPDIPPIAMLGPNVATMTYVVRSATLPLVSAKDVRRAIDAVDANLALAQMQSLEEILDHASALMTFTMVLLIIAASLALMLGVIGIYGVVSYIVSQRTAEIGIRLALGAQPQRLTLMIVRQGGVVTLAGIMVGLIAALSGGQLIESLLYDVSPRDPAVFLATTVTLLGIAVLACWLPARRAARLNLTEVLHMD